MMVEVFLVCGQHSVNPGEGPHDIQQPGCQHPVVGVALLVDGGYTDR